MNIFLDTSILYKDPFWKGNFYSELLDIVRVREIYLYTSSVVIKELEKNYGKVIDEENLKLRKIIDQASHYNFIAPNLNQIDKQNSITGLLDFYDKLVKEGIINLLDFNNEILPEIVERAIWRKKPFSETKTELKDAIIWLTYSKYAERENLSECVLLTDNVSDFCNPEKLRQNIYEIHPDLIHDTNRFKIYKSPKELIQQEKEKLQFVSQRFDNWLKEKNFDDAFIMDIIDENFKEEIERGIERKYENSDIGPIFGNDYFRTGFLSFENFYYENIDDINIDVFQDECLISADLYVHCLVDGFEYQPAADFGEEKYKFIGAKELIVKVVFSFFYDRNEKPRQFDLDLIETNFVR